MFSLKQIQKITDFSNQKWKWKIPLILLIIILIAILISQVLSFAKTPELEPKKITFVPVGQVNKTAQTEKKKVSESVEISSSESSQPKEVVEEKVEDEVKTEVKNEEPKPQEIKVEPAKELPKQEAPKILTETPKTSFRERTNNLGINPDLSAAMEKAANHYGFKPEYLLTIGLSENVIRYNDVGDNGYGG